MKRVSSKRTHELNILIGNRIKSRRNELNITQEELANILGFAHKTSIAKIENATRELQTEDAFVLAPILKVQPEYLLGFTDKMNEDDNEMKKAAKVSNRLIDDPELTDVVLRITELEPEKRTKVIQAINLLLD